MQEGFDLSLRPQQCKSVSPPAVPESPAHPGIAPGRGTARPLSQRKCFYFSLLRSCPGFLAPVHRWDVRQTRSVAAGSAPCPGQDTRTGPGCQGSHRETPLQRPGPTTVPGTSFYGEKNQTNSDQPQKQHGENPAGCAGGGTSAHRGLRRSSCGVYKPSQDIPSMTAPVSC